MSLGREQGEGSEGIQSPEIRTTAPPKPPLGIRRLYMRCLVLLIAVLASGYLAFAQTDRANVTGVVTDPSQGAVPDARVSLHSLATGSERSALTNGAGVYTFSALPVGQYEILITAKGFQELRIQDFSLDVGKTRTLNADLRVAAVRTDVTVVGATPDLNVTSAEVGGVIQGSQLQALPVNGRYWASLEVLAPGAISSGTGTQDTIRFSGLSQEEPPALTINLCRRPCVRSFRWSPWPSSR